MLLDLLALYAGSIMFGKLQVVNNISSW